MNHPQGVGGPQIRGTEIGGAAARGGGALPPDEGMAEDVRMAAVSITYATMS